MRRIAVILCISCYLWIAGCMNLAPAQPSTLMREVAEACAHQFPGIEVKNVTPLILVANSCSRGPTPVHTRFSRA
jgi:hypothetical protein